MSSFIKFMKNKGHWKQSPKTIDTSVLEAPVQFKNKNDKKKQKKENNKKGLKRIDIKNIFGIDCEMVGVGEGSDMKDVLARVSIVTKDKVLFNTFVRVEEEITELRTEVSGVTAEKLAEADHDFQSAFHRVRDILDQADVIVGHGLDHDQEVLKMEFPYSKVRDTSRYRPFLNGGRTPSLKRLTKKYLNMEIQEGEHDPVMDARAAVKLYLLVAIYNSLLYFINLH